LSQCCGKVPTPSDTDYILITILLKVLESIPDLSISDSPNPFKDPVEKIVSSKEWFTDKGNHIKTWTDKDGQINLEIVEGPDRGTHRFYDPEHQREGQTGVENPRTGERRHDNG